MRQRELRIFFDRLLEKLACLFMPSLRISNTPKPFQTCGNPVFLPQPAEYFQRQLKPLARQFKLSLRVSNIP